MNVRSPGTMKIGQQMYPEPSGSGMSEAEASGYILKLIENWSSDLKVSKTNQTGHHSKKENSP